jgi:hypothetical protein
MRLHKTKPEEIPVYRDGKLQDAGEIQRDYSTFREFHSEEVIATGIVKMENKEMKLKDTYGLGNTCQNFAINYLTQLLCRDKGLDPSKVPDISEIDPDEKVWATFKEMYGLMKAKVEEKGSVSSSLTFYYDLDYPRRLIRTYLITLVLYVDSEC